MGIGNRHELEAGSNQQRLDLTDDPLAMLQGARAVKGEPARPGG